MDNGLDGMGFFRECGSDTCGFSVEIGHEDAVSLEICLKVRDVNLPEWSVEQVAELHAVINALVEEGRYNLHSLLKIANHATYEQHFLSTDQKLA